ncbi:MAG: 16S rRNA (adenine(1518)-N(6)/adenine(1519)-N(6))-dimethyltransferase RsmA, partial [Thermomicrobium sp.]|nr:16S rRNA (adenine(1518)-N(6)/adenine(1519)-N(6))-dimethyltransferase RsmA [Thermomicrobium sp.]
MSTSSPISPTDHQPTDAELRLSGPRGSQYRVFRPRKALGQHFLHDPAIVRRIVETAQVPKDALVVEIGPGLGILTEELAQRAATVIAVELDDRLVDWLAERFRDRNVRLVHADALEVDFAELTGRRPYLVVANLPYNVATPILERLLSNAHPPQRLVVMVQREVAERMVASPPHMSFLSVLIQFFARPRIAFRVGPGAFRPPPKVESAVVVLEPRNPPLPRDEWEAFFATVRAGFAQRRKQLLNALSTGLRIDKSRLRQLLERAAIAPDRRAETLTL